MSWFRRSSRAHPANRPAPLARGAGNSIDMSKSLCSLDEQRIERLEPEEFFHDPVHVRHYKEEAKFLSFMADWEIVDHPQQENYFSADFEEELLQPQQQQQQQQTVLCKKSKYASSSLSSIGSISTGTTTTTSNTSTTTTMTTMTTTATCPQQVLKDCRINRKQLKTEALAGSIMGAIGKCPNPELKPTVGGTVCPDACHPGERNTCDHYDIKQFFHLDDQGNILLNMAHIVECRALGLALQAQSRRLYLRYRRGCECADEKPCDKPGCCTPFILLLRLLCRLLFGHPRNKMNIQSVGPGDSLRAYTLQLAQDPNSTFARNIENFISCTKESREAAPQVVMRNMRQFMSGMKNYLVKHGEGKFHAELESARARLKSDEFLNLDAMLETVMHQLVVLPLREHLYGIFVDYYKRSEDIQLLAQNVRYAYERDASDFGIRPTVTPPSQSALRLISNLLWRLQEAELPLDKLELFLCVISTVFDATGCPRGQQLGADDFLPVLVYVVAKCGFVGAEIEAEFMWGLLQPTLLNGEPGYYLTALCSAVQVLKTFMASEGESGSGSLDWRSSCLPACSSVLRVIIPDECNGSLQTRTLPVRPHTTTREVCRIIAHKARITNPQDYALFKLVDGEETLLTDAECPQDARLAAKGKHCMLAYKRIDAKIAWPTAAQPGSH
ncbi:PREDICTED: protein sprint isoform X4 [Drosophila arizonae]|uniref:Protein sprint isoform X4 n=1 Tax=Drosophila arizonae TaxID=7263 RepID=A0ABM1PUA7_DROAR|nr:PREDICTED: protein sprint isoform X4 [Drosophila arizonae]